MTVFPGMSMLLLDNGAQREASLGPSKHSLNRGYSVEVGVG